MTLRVYVLTGLILFLAIRIICDWLRISMLKRFALQNGLIEPTVNLLWNAQALQQIDKNLPFGPIRNRNIVLKSGAWVASLSSLAMTIFLAFQQLHKK
jgi:hypothetical protein